MSFNIKAVSYTHLDVYKRQILVTTKLVDMCPDIISEIKLKQQKPLITEIPDRHGNSKIGETIDGYVSEAIGVKL